MESILEKRDSNSLVGGYMDMHMHSELSDGDIKCEQLPSILMSKGINVFSVTDHDCIESYNQLSKLNLGQLEFYPGVELSSIYKGIKMHILAYGFDPHNGELMSLLQQIQLLRRMRFKAMLGKMNSNMGIRFDTRLIDRMEERCKSVGSANILSLLTKSGYYASTNDLYQRYIRPSNPHIKYRVDCEESTRIVKKAGGILILAHPFEIERENPNINIENIIQELFALGIDGLEAYNSLHSRENVQRYLIMAQQYNGLISGGSDYHGMFVKPGVELGGVTKEHDKIKSLTLVDELRKRNRNSISCNLEH